MRVFRVSACGRVCVLSGRSQQRTCQSVIGHPRAMGNARPCPDAVRDGSGYFQTAAGGTSGLVIRLFFHLVFKGGGGGRGGSLLCTSLRLYPSLISPISLSEPYVVPDDFASVVVLWRPPHG